MEAATELRWNRISFVVVVSEVESQDDSTAEEQVICKGTVPLQRNRSSAEEPSLCRGTAPLQRNHSYAEE